MIKPAANKPRRTAKMGLSAVKTAFTATPGSTWMAPGRAMWQGSHGLIANKMPQVATGSTEQKGPKALQAEGLHPRCIAITTLAHRIYSSPSSSHGSKWIKCQQNITAMTFAPLVFSLRSPCSLSLALAYFQPVSQIMERLRSHICISEGQIFSLWPLPSLASPRDCTSQVATKWATAEWALLIPQRTQARVTDRAMATW